MLLYVVAYDIPCNKRRKKVSDLLEGYGQRVQYSVFECQLTTDQYNELRKRLKKQVKLAEDNVRFYPLSRHTLAQVETWGIGSPVIEPPSSVII
ncbi:CRISPR-associated endonuclease Cas2 [Fischerella thermalis CCMEE 5268]|uniref:CRISPR-associated endoribonuclease Cas2 n=1 Tax=Fischerella thermalis CCMEE 5268 TaxID=2019662 RepID=A0A2N6KAE2_9CYAN|nr:CRISPR-associated endonuclease Cas2 [Fischerella thermalis]PLZ95174.1 CRISPR-associated endonuclease Cas2 [Fischerella thermalis CCMEE 5268]